MAQNTSHAVMAQRSEPPCRKTLERPGDYDLEETT